MKTLRIVNEKGCVYVERNFFRRWWYRLSKRFATNIEAYNRIKRHRNVNLVTKR